MYSSQSLSHSHAYTSSNHIRCITHQRRVICSGCCLSPNIILTLGLVGSSASGQSEETPTTDSERTNRMCWCVTQSREERKKKTTHRQHTVSHTEWQNERTNEGKQQINENKLIRSSNGEKQKNGERGWTKFSLMEFDISMSVLCSVIACYDFFCVTFRRNIEIVMIRFGWKWVEKRTFGARSLLILLGALFQTYFGPKQTTTSRKTIRMVRLFRVSRHSFIDFGVVLLNEVCRWKVCAHFRKGISPAHPPTRARA